MLLFLTRHIHIHLLYLAAPSDPMRLYVFDTNQITSPGMQLQQLKHSHLVRPVDFESLDSFTGPQMDHLAVKIEINNTAVRTLTARLQFNLAVEDTTRDKKHI